MRLKFTSEDTLGSIARGIARLQELELADDIDEVKAVLERLNLPAMRDADLWNCTSQVSATTANGLLRSTTAGIGTVVHATKPDLGLRKIYLGGAWIRTPKR